MQSVIWEALLASEKCNYVNWTKEDLELMFVWCLTQRKYLLKEIGQGAEFDASGIKDSKQDMHSLWKSTCYRDYLWNN